MKRPMLRWPDIEAPPADRPASSLGTRLTWMALIWAGSVTALLGLASLLRLVLKA